MRRNTHILFGLLFGIIGFVLLKVLRTMNLPSLTGIIYSLLGSSFLTIILMLGGTVSGAILPDILDPPFSSRHRRFAHSRLLFMILLILWCISLLAILKRTHYGVLFLYYFLLGYISHLSIDATTPYGLW